MKNPAAVQPLGHRAHAVGRVGEAVEQQRAATHLRRRQDLRAVEVGGEPRGSAAAGRHVAIGHQRIGAVGHHRIDPLPGLGEHRVFAPQVVVEREALADVSGARLEGGHQVMPGLQVRQAAHRRHGATERERPDQGRQRAHHANHPTPQHAGQCLTAAGRQGSASARPRSRQVVRFDVVAPRRLESRHREPQHAADVAVGRESRTPALRVPIAPRRTHRAGSRPRRSASPRSDPR